MLDEDVSAGEALEFRKMRDLPNLAAQTAQAATAMAKFAADRAMAGGSEPAKLAGSNALQQAQHCVRALIALETALLGDAALPAMLHRISAALASASEAVEAAGAALERAEGAPPL